MLPSCPGVDAQVALTLRTVTGLAPAEIARAFLVPERTLQQRLQRAKRKIAAAGIPFRLPPDDQLPDRVGAACAVVYLIFNEGYDATRGDQLLRVDLAAEAIRLGRLLVQLAHGPTTLRPWPTQRKEWSRDAMRR